MKTKALKVLIVLFLTSFTSCSQNSTVVTSEDGEIATVQNVVIKKEQHRYGGWYCPDNLNGFPAVNLSDWKNVAVVNGRMPSKEETQNGTSLIFVDSEKYPNAKPLDMTMPKLATYFNYSTSREEYIIVIQAVNIDNDSIVGFRYLNGGNGSARLNEVKLLSDAEVSEITTSKFVTLDIDITATPVKVWEILTKNENTKALQPIFDENNTLKTDWKNKSNVNFIYPNAGLLMAGFADLMYGSYYIQNDYEVLNYSEKFFLEENMESKNTKLKMVCGPFGDDYEAQKVILTTWAQKVKTLSERN